MALTTFGQDFKAANRLTSAQVDLLDRYSGIGSSGRVETDADAEELEHILKAVSVRTLNSLYRRGLIDAHGLTALGADVLAAHI